MRALDKCVAVEPGPCSRTGTDGGEGAERRCAAEEAGMGREGGRGHRRAGEVGTGGGGGSGERQGWPECWMGGEEAADWDDSLVNGVDSGTHVLMA